MRTTPHLVTIATTGCVALLLVTSTPAAGEDEKEEPSHGSVVTVAGTGESGYSGDGGDAVDARLNDRLNIDVDADGNLYIADTTNNRVRTVEEDGTITTVAGTGDSVVVNDDLGDGGPAPEAVVRSPGDVVADSDGTVYLTSMDGIRMVDPDGTIETIVESETEEDIWTVASHPPTTLALDAHGNLYFTQPNTNQVQVIVRPGDMGWSLWLQVTLTSLGILVALMAAAAIALRDQLGMLARHPRRIPGAVATLPVLLLARILDGLSYLEQRLGRANST